MPEQRYHCFWREPVGNHYKYEETYDFERVQELLRDNASYNVGEYGSVADLRVIYGELLVFEPVEVATRWKIRDQQP